jgi:Fe-S-cluster-containing dehydrogenase component
MQQCFRLNIDRCTGCRACSLACLNEHQLEPKIQWRKVTTFNESRIPGIRLINFSLACNHCVDAPCVKACPARAMAKDPESGVVTIDPARCMGCNYCQWICPFDAPAYDDKKKVMTKCDMCRDRAAVKELPACVTACPTGALDSGDFGGEVVEDPRRLPPGIEVNMVKPALELSGISKDCTGPQILPVPTGQELQQIMGFAPRRADSKVELKTEWSLLAFAFLAPVLWALFVASLVTPIEIPRVSFLCIGLFVLLLSTIHLGRPGRFINAITNWRGSWLSREVILFSVFVVGAFVALWWKETPPFAMVFVGIIGYLALYAIDRVYMVASNSRRQILSSASATLTGVYLAGVFVASPFLFVVAGLIKLFCYLVQIPGRVSAKKPLFLALSMLRLVLGLAASLLVFSAIEEKYAGIILGAVLLGELVDRAEFYIYLEFAHPSNTAADDLLKRVLVPSSSRDKRKKK